MPLNPIQLPARYRWQHDPEGRGWQWLRSSVHTLEAASAAVYAYHNVIGVPSASAASPNSPFEINGILEYRLRLRLQGHEELIRRVDTDVIQPGVLVRVSTISSEGWKLKLGVDYETVQHILNGMVMSRSAVSIWPDSDSHAVYALDLQGRSRAGERALDDLIARTNSHSEASRAATFAAPLLFKLAYYVDHTMAMDVTALSHTPEFVLRDPPDRSEIVHHFEEI